MDFKFDPERTVLGTVFTHAGEEQLALTEADRLRHMLVIGKTGMGKTSFIKNVVIQDIHTGRGVGVIDPHGDLARELLDEIPSSRARDLVYIDPSDEQRVVTFNAVRTVPRDKIAARAADIVSTFKALWDSWGPRLERILYNAVAALIEAPNTSLLGLPRLLKNERYRDEVLAGVSDPIVRGFFAEEYAVWDDDFRVIAIDPVLNKIEQLLSSPVVRAMLGTNSSSIDFSTIMDERKILIANLAKGNLGEGHAHLLGAMLVSGFSHAAMERGGTARQAISRVPYHLVVDEWQNFTTHSFSSILSESRKWKLGLVLTHQYLQQADERLRAAVLGNVGSIVAFQLSSEDAETIAGEIGLKRPAALTELSVGQVWMKHATHGGPYHPRLLDPIVTGAKGREAALKQNALRNTYPRKRVEEKILRFLTPREHRSPSLPAEDRWPRALRVLRTALTKALKEHGQAINGGGDTTPTAVDIQQVRAQFLALHISYATSVEEREAEREMAFRRASRAAQQRHLLAAVERDGTQWVWRID